MSGEGGGVVADGAELVNLSKKNKIKKKKKLEKKHTVTPSNIVGHFLGLF